MTSNAAQTENLDTPNTQDSCEAEVQRFIKFLQKLLNGHEGRKIRLTLLGPAGAGKSIFGANLQAVMQGNHVVIPPHVSIQGNHGSRWLAQNEWKVTSFDLNVSIVITDLKGVAFDGTEKKSLKQIAHEACNIFFGVFPSNLLNVPEEAKMLQGPIEQHSQDSVLLVFSADMLHNDAAETCLAIVSKQLAEYHLPFFVVLTKIDLLPRRHTLESAIDRLSKVTARDPAFIYPVKACTKNWEQPSTETTCHLLKLLSAIVEQSMRLRPYTPSIKHYGKVRFQDAAYKLSQAGNYVNQTGYLNYSANKVLVCLVALLLVVIAYMASIRS